MYRCYIYIYTCYIYILLHAKRTLQEAAPRLHRSWSLPIWMVYFQIEMPFSEAILVNQIWYFTPPQLLCVFRILRSTSINNIPEDYHETCKVFPLREAKYTIAPWWTRNGGKRHLVRSILNSFGQKVGRGSYWRWLTKRELFGRDIPENIKGHRYRLVKTIIIVGQMTQLKSVRFSCIPDAWGFVVLKIRWC